MGDWSYFNSTRSALDTKASLNIYSHSIGLYDLTDPSARLLIQTNAGPVDAYPIAIISVE
jgi:hypothetical protein